MAVGEEDRISELPEAVLHDILSMIPIKYAARTSTLSKRWNCIWQTLPFLNFDESFYLPEGKSWISKSNTNWKKKATQIILSRCQQEDHCTNLQKLCLVIPKEEDGDEDFRWELETLMHDVAKTGLVQLRMILNCKTNVRGEEHPNLPSALILPRSINVLHLSGFRSGEGLKSLVPGTGPVPGFVPTGMMKKFWYLKTLNLNMVKMKDEAVDGLNVLCPSLENLEMSDCPGLKNLHLSAAGFPKLKQLILRHLHGLVTLKLEVLPNLRLLILEAISPSCKVVILDDLISNSKTQLSHDYNNSLRFLELYGYFLTDDLFNEFSRKYCRFLESLYIGGSRNLKKVSIAMDRIQVLDVVVMENLSEVEIIRAPMLRQFNYYTTNTNNRPPTMSLKLPRQIFVSIVLVDVCTFGWTLVPDDCRLNKIWREFFGYFNHANCRLRLCTHPLFLDWLKREGPVSPLCSLKDFVFYNGWNCHDYSLLELLEFIIFLAPRVTTLSITTKKGSHMPFTPGQKTLPDITFKFLYDEKKVGETPSSSSSSSNHQFQFLGIESWLQSVSEVTIQDFEGEEDDLKEVYNIFRQIKHLKFVA